ncbi:reverse transcriptase domain-containing protein [Tanacetum coccineum]
MSNKELESKVEDMVEEVKTKMGELFGTYKERFDFLSSNSSMGEHMESEVTSPNNGDNDFLNDYYNVDATSSYETETELDRYLREPKIELRKGQSLDILQWWKVNGPRFPIVSKMARDILAIQISTVASEAAFSTGGRVLDPYRTRLSTTIVEALICTQDLSGTPSRRRDLKKRLGSRRIRGMSGSPEPRRDRSESPRKRDPERKIMFKRLKKGVFHRLGDKGKSIETEFASEKHHNKRASSRRMEALSESEGSVGGHWKSKPKRQKSSIKDDLSQPWVCEETDPFTPRIRYFDFPKTRMPSHIKTYDESEDPEDHLKIFQATVKTEHWAMPTWCHMFNSTLIGNARVWFDDLPQESIDSYDDLKKTFLENYLQQKKCIKDPVEIHNIKQRDGESTEKFVQRYKLECKDVKGAPECMKISVFIHEITNPELIKRLHDKIPKSVDEMMRVTTTFRRGEVAASSRERKKSLPSWKQQEARQKQNFKKGGFRNQQRSERKQDRFTLLTKTPKEILALDKGKFKPPPPMTTPVEKRNASKFCEFHGEVGHTIDECMHLKRQIEEMLKAGKLSHLIKELKQSNGKDQTKAAKKGETSGKDKPLAILMVQP